MKGIKKGFLEYLTILLEKEMATHSSVLAWKIPWTERSLAGCSPWDRKESDTAEQFHF